MSLEEALAKNTAALEANTAALKGAKPAATTGTTGGAAKGNKHSLEEVTALMTKVKEKFDVETAKGIIKKYGGADKLKDITDLSKLDAVFDAGTKKLAEEPASEPEGGDGL